MDPTIQDKMNMMYFSSGNIIDNKWAEKEVRVHSSVSIMFLDCSVDWIHMQCDPF